MSWRDKSLCRLRPGESSWTCVLSSNGGKSCLSKSCKSFTLFEYCVHERASHQYSRSGQLLHLLPRTPVGTISNSKLSNVVLASMDPPRSSSNLHATLMAVRSVNSANKCRFYCVPRPHYLQQILPHQGYTAQAQILPKDHDEHSIARVLVQGYQSR